MIKGILQNFNIFVDGRGQQGQTDDIQLPDLKVMMQEYGYGGMAGKVDIPMGCIEKMECSFTLKAFEGSIFSSTAITPTTIVPLIARGVMLDNDGTKHSVIATMRGTVKVEKSAWKVGEVADVKVMMAVNIYNLTIDGIEREHADPENMIIRINGVDQLAEERAILGV